MRAFRKEIKDLKKLTGRSYTRHHRVCKSNGGTDDPDNIAIVPRKCHSYWHALFANLSPEAIALVISERWISKDLKMVVVPANSTIVMVKK